MTGLDPRAVLVVSNSPGLSDGQRKVSNARLTMLRPQLEAADALAAITYRYGEDEASWRNVLDALSTYLNARDAWKADQ
jgi:hypothetical protein